MTTIVRFAPSPTGFLHIGNARLAVWNWLHARRLGGRFILRLDDTDRERSEARFAEAIVEDLAWLGIVPDLILRQSDRLDRYAAALERLKTADRVYPAYETGAELDLKRKRQQARGLPPVYDRAALSLTAAERAALESAGRRPHWRFRLSGSAVEWPDGVRGPSRIETSALSDPVLVREDGAMLYTFASVVDDIELGISDVVRGEDHVANTAVQIEVFEALGSRPPAFAHLNLIVSLTGEEMSKRLGTLSLRSFREQGAEPQAVAAVAAFTGTSLPVQPVASLGDLVPDAVFSIVSRAQTRFDPAEIMALTARLLHLLPYQAVADRLAATGMDGPRAEPFWLAVRGNLATFADVGHWVRVVEGPFAGLAEEPAYLAAAADLLPDEPWDDTTWQLWTEAVKAGCGRKGRALFMPLRLAITGRDSGPELKALLPLVGRRRVLARLRGQAA